MGDLMYKPLVCSLLALLATGCVGDGGGSAYQGDVGTETPANQGGPYDVGNETPAHQGGPYDVGTEEGGTPGPSGGQGDDLFDLCMETCVTAAEADYCREEICSDFDNGGGPGPGGGEVDYCEGLTDAEQAILDALPAACQDCICSTNPASAEASCTQACGF